ALNRLLHRARLVDDHHDVRRLLGRRDRERLLATAVRLLRGAVAPAEAVAATPTTGAVAPMSWCRSQAPGEQHCRAQSHCSMHDRPLDRFAIATGAPTHGTS